MIKRIDRKKIRAKKHRRIRNKISGTPECPRICVFRSLNHIEAQIIDDTKGHTLVAASSIEFKKDGAKKGVNVEVAEKVGKLLGEKATAAGIKDVVFDRSGYIYHGKIKALADGARESGLNF